MGNSLINTDKVCMETLDQLENNLVMGKLVSKQYADEFKKVGETVRVRRPVRFIAKDGQHLQIQDVQEGNTEVTINYFKQITFNFPSRDLTLTIDDARARYLQPAGYDLAQSIDEAIMDAYSGVWNLVGTAGTTPNSFAAVGAAGQRLDEGAVPRRMRSAVFNPAAGWAIKGALTQVYVERIASSAIREAEIGRFANFDTYEAQGIPVHLAGTQGGTPLVDGASQTSTYAAVKNSGYKQDLDVKGASNSITNWARKGDVFTIADVYAVNPRTHKTTGQLQTFVVNANADSSGGGLVTLSISPPIITSGPYQTVDSAPADSAPITFKTGASATSHPQNLCFTPEAFTLVTVPIELPTTAHVAAHREVFNGVSLRAMILYDQDNDQMVYRLDCMFGVKAIYPELACRLIG